MKTAERISPKKIPALQRYTQGEEILNSVSHGVGAIFAVAGTVVLIVWSVLRGGGWEIVSGAVYGGTLILLYTMSTLYHAITNEKAKRVLRILDHSTIFLLIAGTYTPYALVTLRNGSVGWTVFGLVWGSAIIGIVLNAISVERFKKISMLLYLAAGWAVVIAIQPMALNLAPGGLWLLLIGGLFYTGGILFYVQKKIKYFHGVWHFFVLAGSICHYFSILFYVIGG